MSTEQEASDYQNIISLEASGDQIERLPNTGDERGRMLVMVSTTDDIRDRIRETVREHLHDGVTLSELEYQPSADGEPIEWKVAEGWVGTGEKVKESVRKYCNWGYNFGFDLIAG